MKQAIKLVNETRAMCRLGGLHLHNFLSTSEEVMLSIPRDDRALPLRSAPKILSTEAVSNSKPYTELLSKSTSIEKALDVGWCVTSDTLQFRINLNDHRTTRRGVLSSVASIYDPLGLASPLILGGKQILQETIKEGLDWDEELSDGLRAKWELWRSSLDELSNLKVPRFYKPQNFGRVIQVELHHFADASVKGYGTCSYLRQVQSEGRVHCSLVLGKARVTPLKSITIPRLEQSLLSG